MPDVRPKAHTQIIALLLMVSAIALGVMSFLIYTGSLPLGRAAALVVGVAAIVDLLMGIVFFRKGQSS